METKLLTVIEAAQYLKMGRSTVYKLAQEGKLPKDKVGRRCRFDAKELDKTLKEEDLLRLWGVFQRGLMRAGKKKPASYAGPSNYCYLQKTINSVPECCTMENT